MRKIYLIRHGKTKGNVLKKYIGITDEGLCKEGIEEIKNNIYPEAERLAVSPLKRCIETAELIYPSLNTEIYTDLRECDFGEFENKSYEELKDNPHYISWLKGGGEAAFPNGESKADFTNRCIDAFKSAIQKDERDIAFVVHGGTIMAIASAFCVNEKSFYDWQIKNGEFLAFNLEIKNDIISLYEIKEV